MTTPTPTIPAAAIRDLATILWEVKRRGNPLTKNEQQLWDLIPKLLRDIEAPTVAAKRAAKRAARPEGITGAIDRLKNYNLTHSESR